MFKTKVSHKFKAFVLEGNLGSRDRETERKLLLYFTICALAIVVLFFQAIIAVYQGANTLGVIDFCVGMLLVGFFVFLKKTGRYEVCCLAANLVITCLLLFLFVSGKASGNGFMWYYTFPLIALSLFGVYYGTIATLVLFVPSLIFLCFDVYSSKINLYNFDFALRFIPSFLTVFFFSYLYEKSRIKQQQELIQAHGQLESRIQERTKELVEEIKERRKAQSATLLAKKEWEWTFNSLPDQIIITNDKFEILRANKAVIDKFGLGMEELIHSKCYQLFHHTSEPPTFCPQKLLREDRKSHAIDFYDDISKKYLNISHTPLHDEQGNFAGVIHVTRDITARKEAEQKKAAAEDKLRKAEKMEAIGLMAGGVAHDLNNILSGIVSYPEILLYELPENSTLRQPLETIRDSGERAADIVADLLTVARGIAAKKIIASLNTLVTEYLDSPEHRKLISLYPSVTFSTELQADLMNISCSPVHIKKCLMNLTTNAAEAIAGKGGIVISTRSQTIDRFPAGKQNLRPGNYVVLGISDNGPGIPAKDIERIFEPFYTKKVMGRSGTGLGLAVVWNTVHDHGGGIDVSSSEQGTMFELFFPITDEKMAVGSESLHVDQLKGKGEKILIVDDERRQLDIADRMLSFLNYRVETVSSGEEALEYLEKNKVDLLVLDMMMEPGMSGCETYEKAIKIQPELQAVIASGFTEDEDVRKAQKLGAGQFVKKPYSLAELAVPVKQALKNKLAIC